VLLCPLLHWFLHGRHKGDHMGHDHGPQGRER
jgi:hypothetical protein